MSLRDAVSRYFRCARVAELDGQVMQAFMDLGNPCRSGMFAAASNYGRSEMIANALFVVMATLTFLGTSGSMIHIFKNLGR
jgi:hypothetical protein